jgi:hypothetical protein
MPKGFLKAPGQLVKGVRKLLGNVQMTQNLLDRCSFWLLFHEKEMRPSVNWRRGKIGQRLPAKA